MNILLSSPIAFDSNWRQPGMTLSQEVSFSFNYIAPNHFSSWGPWIWFQLYTSLTFQLKEVLLRAKKCKRGLLSFKSASGFSWPSDIWPGTCFHCWLMVCEAIAGGNIASSGQTRGTEGFSGQCYLCWTPGLFQLLSSLQLTMTDGFHMA